MHGDETDTSKADDFLQRGAAGAAPWRTLLLAASASAETPPTAHVLAPGRDV
jgi:predicted transcriptional regulator of viral defense system